MRPMTSKRILPWLNLFGLLLTFVGAVFLDIALSVKTSAYKFVETEDHTVVLCHDNKVVGSRYGGGLRAGESCPKGIGPSDVPVVETNNPSLAFAGLILVSIGFLLQGAAALGAIRYAS